MKYRKIIQNNKQVVGQTIDSLKKQIQKGKLKVGDGQFRCLCPNGNIHIWTIEISTYKSHGHNPRGKKSSKSKKMAYGKNVDIVNTTAKFVKVAA